MGNKPYRIALRIDEPHRPHQAGEVITGRVYFGITEQADFDNLKGIHLVLEGHEHVEISRAESSRHEYNRRIHETDPQVERSTRVLVLTEYPIARFEGKLRPGQYEYPFRLRLPTGLPSSMQCRQEHDGEVHSSAEIRYTLAAVVVLENQSFFASWSASGYTRDSLVLHVVGGMTGLEGKPISVQPEFYPIHSCLLWQKGRIRMGWHANTDVLKPHDIVSVKVEGENQSQVPVHFLTVELIETINVRAGSHNMNSRMKRTVAKKTLSVQSLECWQPNYKPDSCQGPNYKLLKSDESCSVHPNRIDLRLPFDVRDTYAGDLITVRHSLVVTAETPGYFTITDPESSHLVHIVRSPAYSDTAEPHAMNTDHQRMQMVEAQILPPGWKPVVANVLDVPEAFSVIVDEASEAGATFQEVPAATITPSVPHEFPDRGATHDTFEVQVAPTVQDLQNLAATHPQELKTVLNNGAWITLVQNLSPRDFCMTVQQAGPYGPSVARTLALTMGSSLKTRHLLAWIYALPDSPQRMEVLRQTAPLVSDLSSNMSLIEQELSHDELLHFHSALKK